MMEPKDPVDDPGPIETEPGQSPKLTILSVLRGSLPLWQAFWFLWLLGGCVILVLTELIQHVVWAVFHYRVQDTMIVGPFLVYCWIAVWRSAFNVRRRHWGYLARSLVIVNVLAFFFVLFARFYSSA